MSLTNHYPFATIPLNYNLTSFEDFLDFQTLSIHYNQIYKEFVDDLNFILSTEISLQKLTLDEILFNEKILSPFRKNDIIKYAGGVYNHQIVFRSITPNPIVSICPELKKAIENKYKTMLYGKEVMNISAVAPTIYSNRMLEFAKEHIFVRGEE